MSELTCGGCSHFERKIDPLNLAANQGECLEGPPRALPQGSMAGGSIAMAFFYPVLSPDFKACHRYQPRLTLAEDAGK